MKIFKDLHTFKKAVRKYYKKHSVKTKTKLYGKKLTSYWTTDIWCGYLVTNKEELLRNDVNDFLSYEISPELLKDYSDNWMNNVGKKCKFINPRTKEELEGIFNGVMIVNNGAMLCASNENETFLIQMFYDMVYTK